MNDQLMTQDSTIFIRRELQQMGVDLRGKQLRRVVLRAKSKAGKAKVALQVGRDMYPVQNIGQAQNGFDFQSNRPASYDRIAFPVRGDTRGVWQLDMRGRIKVNRVIVVLD